ncbi:DUF305 domain-containing protein [Actinobacteria bacterium YIM 96077]|uniref:DUF305 domain-containing protein n=1 Tax=Phytoactinopolyspora halophila TaxID=1981511 RepID=A0A329R313_9ACTN|nr:DUF305 domain-containing protein [Phytoactinopolyspora halophila]AYY13377.1 DUF305 domain-containing protein [Actinobacteria bacterium YIM 96077]RAW17388.1 hypothetical protein DPM12_04995 [Phytoactinopolyspora halophila]
MRYRKAAGAALIAACMFGAAPLSATAAEQPRTASSDATYTSAAATQTAPNPADVEFVTMMIPHHFQALVMSAMAPDRSEDDELLAMANRIDVAQTVEIDTMQGWQSRNGLEVTDAQESYEEVLQQPDLLEQMGMATPAELDDLSAAEGTAFDVQFLELMIEHHEGAVRMTIEVITNGSDPVIQQMATDMLTTQSTQIQQMEAMLEDKTS